MGGAVATDMPLRWSWPNEPAERMAAGGAWAPNGALLGSVLAVDPKAER